MEENRKQQVALVTGASRGIGRAVALELASMGVAVAVNYRGSQEQAQEVCQEIRKQGGEAECFPFDVADVQETTGGMEAILERFGRLDILVNNAGITRDGLLMGMKEEDYQQVLDTNLGGTFHCMRFAAKQMVKQKYGRIINLSSVSGVMGNAGQANYSASKAGIIGLTKAAAKELARKNITVNAVAPGFIDTEMTAVLKERVKEAALTQIPVGRFGSVEDIAHAVAFLARPESGYITGQILHVDGGMAM